MRHLLSRTLPRALAGATALVLLTAGPAAAAPSSPTTSAPASSTALPGAGQAALAEQYTSLSGALINYYATSSSQTLSDYLAAVNLPLSPVTAPTDPGTGTAAPTATVPSSGALPSTGPAGPTGPTAGTGPVSTLAQLNATLARSGMTLDVSAYQTLAQLTAGIAAKADTPDGAITLAGAQWAANLAALHTPTLTTPQAGSVSMPQVPAGALMFGLFLNKSITNLVNDHPDVFANVAKSGLGTPAATAAWNASMLSAVGATQTDIAKVLPDQCAGGMLAVMASGNPASAGRFSCGQDCTAGGMYLHQQAQGLFDHSASSTIPDPTRPVWSSNTYAGLQDWQKALIAQQNPSLNSQLSQTLTGSSGVCATAAQATTGALGSALPGVFGQLAAGK